MATTDASAARATAAFALERLELVDGRLVVRGWWSGVRGVRFVRPALVVDGRQVLATLEHKPWVVAQDGSWTAAFPWTRGRDVDGVSLAVAPSIEVSLARDAPAYPKPELVPAPVTVVEELREPLRGELANLERRLDAAHAELRDVRSYALERDARCRELELAVARERRAADAARDDDDDFVRSHAMAIIDRDRALARCADAVSEREAAVLARSRLERQRDAALAERDEARRQRDELALAHRALEARLCGSQAAGSESSPRPPR